MLRLPDGFINIFVREIRRILTSSDLLLICFVAPLAYGIILSSVYYHRRVQEIPVGVVDQDNTKLSRTFVRWLDATQNIRIENRYDNAGKAMSDMTDGKTEAFLYVPKGFSNELKRGHESHALASVNSANILVANPVMTSLAETSGTISSGMFIKQMRRSGMVSDKALSLNQALSLNVHTVFNPNLNYSDFFLPGLVFVILQQILLVGLGFSVAEEREKGRFPELYALARGSPWALLCGKVLPYVILNFGFGVFYLAGILPHFGINVSNWPGSLLLLLIFVIAVSSTGILISSLFKSTLMALIVLMFYSMPAFLISGFIWPSFSLPLPVRILSYLFPSTYFLIDFRIFVLGDGLFRYSIASIIWMIIYSGVCLALTFVAFRWLLKRQPNTGQY